MRRKYYRPIKCSALARKALPKDFFPESARTNSQGRSFILSHVTSQSSLISNENMSNIKLPQPTQISANFAIPFEMPKHLLSNTVALKGYSSQGASRPVNCQIQNSKPPLGVYQRKVKPGAVPAFSSRQCRPLDTAKLDHEDSLLGFSEFVPVIDQGIPDTLKTLSHVRTEARKLEILKPENLVTRQIAPKYDTKRKDLVFPDVFKTKRSHAKLILNAQLAKKPVTRIPSAASSKKSFIDLGSNDCSKFSSYVKPNEISKFEKDDEACSPSHEDIEFSNGSHSEISTAAGSNEIIQGTINEFRKLAKVCKRKTILAINKPKVGQQNEEYNI